MRSMLRLAVLVSVLGGFLPGPRAYAAVHGEPEVAAESEGLARLGEHESAFLTDRAHAGRAHNVALAAARLDGAIIAPGATFSFNERVGERTVAAGFRVAPELHDGQLHEGVGGGVCQVATGLHIASLRAGLEIVEHRAHSIPLAYAPAGLDATVSYGRIDLRVRNRFDVPVRVRAAAVDGVLVVRLEGARVSEPAEIETTVVRTLARGEQVIDDAQLAPGAREVADRGRDGVVVRVRAIGSDGVSREELVRYAASPRVVRVGS